jgi:dTDP-D-glucose 4,6-dehydratase
MAKEKIGWKPLIAMEEGLKISIDYYEQVLQQGVSGTSV